MRSLAKDLKFTESEITYLEKASRSKTEESRRVNRAKILLLAYKGSKINDIANQFQQTTNAVTNLLKKPLAYDYPKHFGIIATSDEKNTIAYLYFYDEDFDFISENKTQETMQDFIKKHYEYEW